MLFLEDIGTRESVQTRVGPDAYTVTWQSDEELGLELVLRTDDACWTGPSAGSGGALRGIFIKDSGGSEKVQVNDALIGVNGKPANVPDIDSVSRQIHQAQRPVTITFRSWLMNT